MPPIRRTLPCVRSPVLCLPNRRKKTTQIFFPEAAQEIFYQTARFMRDFGRTNNIPVSNAELSEFLTRTTVFAQEGGRHRDRRQLAGTGRAVPHLLFCRPGSYRGRRSPGAGYTQRGTHHAQPPVHWQLQHSRRPVLGPAGSPAGAASGCLSSTSQIRLERLCRFSACCWT